jgi:hypothetical protein
LEYVDELWRLTHRLGAYYSKFATPFQWGSAHPNGNIFMGAPQGALSFSSAISLGAMARPWPSRKKERTMVK